MKHPALLLLAGSLLLGCEPAEAAEAARPNVILIVADDQGSVDLGCYGANDLHTPHLDALAAAGVRFTQFYSAAPVCSPSRAGTLTGRWPGRIPTNEVRHQVAQACDLLPTLADLTGAKPPSVHLDGRSLAAVLRDASQPSPHAAHPVHWQVGEGAGSDWAVRDGPWKLIGNARDTGAGSGSTTRIPLFLANIEDDPGELTNLAERHPERVARLRALHEEHLKPSR